MKITGTIVAIIKQNCILHLFNEKMDENLVDFGCEILNWGLFWDIFMTKKFYFDYSFRERSEFTIKVPVSLE